jgi:copper oxidase (laccase) domain-containing protein
MSIVTLGSLNELDGMRHAFFTRQGGVSTGIYNSLNCGLGSRDAPEAVQENRRRAAAMLDFPDAPVATLYQVHGTAVVELDAPLAPDARPLADAFVSKTPGVILGILTADCAPVLFYDPQARVVGAAHAGWKGALGGVLEATLDAMAKLGADRTRIVGAFLSALGKCRAFFCARARGRQVSVRSARLRRRSAGPGRTRFGRCGAQRYLRGKRPVFQLSAQLPQRRA